MATEEQNVTPTVDDEAALNEEASRELAAMVAEEESAAAMDAETPDDGPLASPQSQAERAAVIEALIYVSEEPLSAKTIADGDCTPRISRISGTVTGCLYAITASVSSEAIESFALGRVFRNARTCS